MNCVRRLWFSGPLSTLSTSVVMCANRSRPVSHHGANRSTKQSLVTLEVTPYTNSSSNAGRKMPTGVRARLGGLSPMKEREEYRIKTELFGMDLVSPFTAIACFCQLRGSPENALTPARQSCLDS